jgi:hypothetical protein
MPMNNKYRIHRSDAKNIVIQKQRQNGKWRTVSFHGNSQKSLVSGLFELIMSQHTPKETELLEQLKMLRVELDKGISEIERMVKDYEQGTSA